MTRAPILELNDATVVKDERTVLDGLTLTIREGEHTAILGPNGAGKSLLVSLLTHYERPLARTSGVPPVRVFGDDGWNVFELRRRSAMVSSDLHLRFVAGNSEGRIRGDAAVLSAFLASHGILRYGEITGEMRERARPRRSRSSARGTCRRAGWIRCRRAKRGASCWRACW